MNKIFFIILLPILKIYDFLFRCKHKSIPVIFYHSVSDINSRLSVSERNFTQQIRYLYKQGYKTISPLNIKKAFLDSRKKIIIMFDDGFRDNLENALPILEKYGFTATVFITTKYLGQESVYCSNPIDKKRKMLNKDDILELRNHGWTIANHFHSHRNLIDLNKEEIIGEFLQAKKILQNIIGHNNSLDIVSYPRNKFNQETINILKNLGLKMAFGGETKHLTEKSDSYSLPRIEIDRDTDMTRFKIYLRNSFWHFRRVIKK